MDYVFWAVLFFAGTVLALILLHGGSDRDEWDQAHDDMDQIDAVTKPAVLETKPHRRAGTGWMGD